MVRPALILLVLLAGCTTVTERAEKAATAQGQARAETPFPDLPAACTAKMGRVKPQPDEARVVTLKRWEIVADVRDRQADDCAAWGKDMKNGRGDGPNG